MWHVFQRCVLALIVSLSLVSTLLRSIYIWIFHKPTKWSPFLKSGRIYSKRTKNSDWEKRRKQLIMIQCQEKMMRNQSLGHRLDAGPNQCQNYSTNQTHQKRIYSSKMSRPSGKTHQNEAKPYARRRHSTDAPKKPKGMCFILTLQNTNRLLN